MSNAPVLFLLGAVTLSLLGGMVVWLLNRPRKERFGSSIDTFNRDLDALAPPGTRRAGPTQQRPPAQTHARRSSPNGVPSSPGVGPRPAPGPNPRREQ
jgi:hypothetical protein